MPELDVLRGCAILAVILDHGLYWSGATSSIRVLRLFIEFTKVGWIGVNLFFVLSGFLITGILIDTKGSRTYYRKFYQRRALRILPAYLALVLFLILIRWLTIPSAIPILLFLANYPQIPIIFHLGGYGPFWSLAVEEQFYLIWPAIVGRTSARAVTILSVALCIIEPFLRWLSASSRLPLGETLTATYLIADNLALGALAALFARSRYGTTRNAIKLGLILCLAGLAIFIAGYPLGIMHRTNIVGLTFQTVPWNLFFTGSLLFLLGLQSPLASSAWTAPLRFFGHISYGLYLYHFLFFVRYDDYVSRLSNPSLKHFLQGSFTRFFLVAGLSIFIAWLSRTFYEERFLRMGKEPKATADAFTAAPAETTNAQSV